MTENPASVVRFSDEDAASARHAKFGELPLRVRPEDWAEETDTDLPTHEIKDSMAIVQHPGRTYET